MERWSFLQFLLYYCLYYYLFGSNTDAYKPEQIHISWGDNPLEVVVTWSTHIETPNVFVRYGIGVLNDIKPGETRIFVDGGKQKRRQFIHKARLLNLQPSQRYIYVCGSEMGISEELWFRTVPEGNSWSPKLAIYGDLGVKNDISLPYLIQDAHQGVYDTFIHVGDFAYDMKNKNGKRGDEFMRNIQPIAAHVPYMVCPGNHEQAYNFSHFRKRFNMPGSSENLYYSFNLGPAHFISINTEAFFYLEYGIKLLTKMFDWLEKDLQDANMPQNREIRPWIITYGHRPMYCSNTNHGCEQVNSAVRIGLEGKWFGLEDMFYHHGVDLSFWGHEHSYERMLPLYNKTIKSGTVEPYLDPDGPVHVTTGSAGCWEEMANFTSDPPPWSAKRLQLYGYSALHIINGSHLHVEQLAVSEGKKVVDDFWIVKNKHRYPSFSRKLHSCSPIN